MRILVTGGTGYVGRALAKRLRDTGHTVDSLGSADADLTRQGALSDWESASYDQLWHLATWTQAGDFCLHHPGEQWIINQSIHTNTVSWWHEKQRQAKFVSLGTSCCYSPELPLTEDNYLRGEPIESLFTYAHAKRMVYLGLTMLGKQFGNRYLCMVPATLYGPGYHTDGRQLHFIFDLIRKILHAKLLGSEVVLWGDGHQRRELLLMDDFLDAALRLSEERENELINVGGGTENSIREFATLICELIDYDFGLIRFDTERYVGAKSKCLDVAKLDGLLPDRPRTALREGLRLTVDWFTEHQEQLLGPA